MIAAIFALLIGVGAWESQVCDPGYIDCPGTPYLSLTKARLESAE